MDLALCKSKMRMKALLQQVRRTGGGGWGVDGRWVGVWVDGRWVGVWVDGRWVGVWVDGRWVRGGGWGVVN